jgi:hypothetical protein
MIINYNEFFIEILPDSGKELYNILTNEKSNRISIPNNSQYNTNVWTEIDIIVNDNYNTNLLLEYPDTIGTNYRYLQLDNLPGIRRLEPISNRGLKGIKKYTKNDKLIWSIEHIMPQNPDKETDWLLIDEEIRKQYIHKIGNLTLTCYNSNLSNKSFIDKTSIKENEKDIGLKSGNVKINEYLMTEDKEEWTIEDIKKRSEKLVDEIMSLLKN